MYVSLIISLELQLQVALQLLASKGSNAPLKYLQKVPQTTTAKFQSQINLTYCQICTIGL
jgi:hypothetical protein